MGLDADPPRRMQLMGLADELQASLVPRADEMAALVEELVAIDTENPPGRRLGVTLALMRMSGLPAPPAGRGGSSSEPL